MLRRVHTPRLLAAGRIELDHPASRHARDVLRLERGTEVEVFDDAGNLATGVIAAIEPRVVIEVGRIAPRDMGVTEITVAAAVPKGDRADWMVEKLSEIGVDRFIPLATARSIVRPEGTNKRERWVRLATESAKQSRRRGVMQIDQLTPLATAVRQSAGTRAIVLSTRPDAKPILDLLSGAPDRVLLFIGPEGGWTDEELQLLQQGDIADAKLTDTVLRIETAALVAAAVVTVAFNRNATP